MPEPIREIPDSANAALQKALAKDAVNRFENCVDFIKALGGDVILPEANPTSPPIDMKKLRVEMLKKTNAEAKAVKEQLSESVPTSQKSSSAISWRVGVVFFCLIVIAMAFMIYQTHAEKVASQSQTTAVQEAEEERLAAEAAQEAEEKQLAAEYAKEAEEERLALETKRKQSAEYASEASEHLGQNRYSEALTSIDEALKLDSENVAYASLQKTIQERYRKDAEEKRLAAEAVKRMEEERIAAEAAKKAEEERLKAGERMVLTIKGVEYPFRWCPAGTFTMGSPKDEKGRSGDETQHSVTLTQGFWMLETEVAQQMWESVTGENPSEFKGAKLPVEMVSWKDCQNYINQLNGLCLAPSGMKFS